MPSLLFVTDNYPPENNAPSYRTHAHCKVWKNLGWKITVLTSVPNAPLGRVFSGFRNKLFQTQTIDGIEIYRIWTFIAANSGFFLRILDFISFFFMSVISSIFLKKHDVVVSTSPQFFAGCSGYLIAKIQRAKWVLEIRDLWPESISTVGRLNKKSPTYRLLFNLALFIYHKADKVIVVTDKTRQILISYGVDGQKILVARNGIDEEDIAFFNNISRSQPSQIKDRKIRVGYVGTIGEAHAMETFIEAAEILNKTDDFEFFLIGNGSRQKEMLGLSEKKGLSNVHFVTELNAQNRNKFLATLDLGVITLKADPLFESVIPSKIFDYAVAKLPILIGVKGEARDIVEGSGLGFYFEPEKSSDLASLITSLKSGGLVLDSRPRAEFIERHSRYAIANKILCFIQCD